MPWTHTPRFDFEGVHLRAEDSDNKQLVVYDMNNSCKLEINTVGQAKELIAILEDWLNYSE